MKDNRIQAAIAILQFHANNFPEMLYLPEYQQLKQRELAMYRSLVAGNDVKLAHDLYISAICELDDTITSLTDFEKSQLKVERVKEFEDDWFERMDDSAGIS
jgi:hypothetical protein